MDRVALLWITIAILMSVVSVSKGSVWKCCGRCRWLGQECIRFGKQSCRCRGRMAIMADSGYQVHGNEHTRFQDGHQNNELSTHDSVLLKEKL
ncbi:hypothetical protein DPMN_027315 [Dreissena polymorpha]|uniref:Uncharacterized protein n=1 Tax=Dreissena polymorpha TaxID=45954 RepID=A0A9D4RDI3_DREPO|nr:hypothetical protein DPMN_027315 [Dreissena polymorpha]